MILSFFLLLSPSLLAQSFTPSDDDLHFLDNVEKKAFEFFLHEHHLDTGLVKDKASNFGPDTFNIASIASTGFGLSAMMVGAERGWVSKEEARVYCLKTLRFFLNQMEDNHGFFYHFVHWGTGKKTKSTELSSIDTALFLAGALTAGEYFKGTEVETLANQIYERVDFPWMMHDGKTLSMGWEPNTGFLKQRWQDYNESLILYLLAIGSPTHPIPAESWQAVKKRIGTYGNYVLVYSPPLFTHQYSAIWMDLRNKNDGTVDYFENSRIATIVNRQFSLDQRTQYRTYSENVWGLTASEGPFGYRAYGSEPGGAVHDGTVAPTAAAGSIVFTPELSLEALKFMHQNFKDKLWGKYGFSDAFNLDRDWYSRNVIGIDEGPIVLMIENLRSELLWKLFMRHPAAIRGMERMGFKPGPITLRVPERPSLKIGPVKGEIQIDGMLDDWDLSHPLKLTAGENLELGDISGPSDAEGQFFFAWDSRFLYVAAQISDDDLVLIKRPDQMWKDDLVEIFIDPEDNSLKWKDPKDFQIGLSPDPLKDDGRSWAWFQGLDPREKEGVELKVRKRTGGYNLEARIPWESLKLSPRVGLSFGLTPALHDIDRDHTEGKLNWYFSPDGKRRGYVLGKATLVSNRARAKR